MFIGLGVGIPATPMMRAGGDIGPQLQALMAAGATAAYTLSADPLYWWQDAAGTIPVTAADQPIRRWVTVNGNAAFTQTVSSDRAPRSALLNGKWSALFDGVDDYLVSEVPLLLGATQTLTIAAGVRKLADNFVDYIVSNGIADGTVHHVELSGYRSFLPGRGTVLYGANTRGAASYSSAGSVPSEAPGREGAHSAVLLAHYDPSVSRGTTLRVNGTNSIRNSTVGGAATYPDTSWYIGGQGACYINGHITEVSIRAGTALADPVPVENLINSHLGAY